MSNDPRDWITPLHVATVGGPAQLDELINQLDEAAARLTHWHDKWLFGDVVPTIWRDNRYAGGEAARALANIDAPSIADTILKVAAYLRELRTAADGEGAR
jgi:hypothetical protein